MAPDKMLATSMFVCTVGEVTNNEFNMAVDHLTSFETLTEGLLIAEIVPVDRYTTWMIFARGCIATLIKEQCNAATIEHVRRAVTEFFDMYAVTDQAGVDSCCGDECCGKCCCGEEEPTDEEKTSDDKDEEAEDKVSRLFFSIDENGDITFDAHAAVGTKGEKLFTTVATGVRNILLDAAMQEAKAKVAEETSKKASKAKTKKK
jgi:bacterioferritin-associated ferredoxin